MPLVRCFLRHILIATVVLGCGPLSFGAEGFIRVMNAVAAEGTLKLTLNRKTFNEEGYPLGGGSGWIGFKPGALLLKGEHTALGNISVPVELAAGDSVAVILFLKTQPPKKVGDEPQRVMRYSTLRCATAKPVKGRRPATTATFLLLDRAEPLELKVGGTVCTLKAGEPQTIALKPVGGLYVPVNAKEQPGLISLSLEEPGNHYVVVYTGADGKLATATYQR